MIPTLRFVRVVVQSVSAASGLVLLGYLNHLGLRVLWRIDVEAKRRPKRGDAGDGLRLEFEVAVRRVHKHGAPELCVELLINNYIAKRVGTRLELV